MSTSKGYKMEKYDGSMSLEEIGKLPYKGYPSRGLSLNVMKTYGVKCEMSVTDGEPIAFYFPHKKKGTITGYKRCCVRAGTSKKEKWRAIGDVDISCDLFGANLQGTNTFRTYITEGEWDCLALHEAQLANPKRKFVPNVVSITFGAGNAAECVMNNKEYLDKSKERVVVFDNDEPGQEAMVELSLVYPEFKTFKIETNDLNDMLLSDKEGLLSLSLNNIIDFQPEDIVTEALSVDELTEPLKKGVYLPILPMMSSKLHGFREGELTFIMAPEGAGKSTVAREIGYGLMTAGEAVGNVFLEESLKKTQQAYIAMDNDVPLAAFREDPSIIPVENIKNSIAKLINNKRSAWLECKFGSLRPSMVMPKFRHMHHLGMKYIIFDHIHMALSGEVLKDERQVIDQLCTEMAAFCESTGVAIICISHITEQKRQPPKDSSGNIDYPYYYKVQNKDARGSGAFSQLAHNIIHIEPQITEDGTRGNARVKIGKNREWGWLGVCDEFEQHPKTGRIQVIEGPV